MKAQFFAPLALLGGAAVCSAQLPDCNAAVSDTVQAVTQAKSTSPVDRNQISNALSNLNLFASCAPQGATANKGADAAVARITQNAVQKRTDVQSGAPSAASGTTTAVSSASKPSFLGLALENGTTTQTTSGTSTTVSINPWKFVDSLAHDFKLHDDPNDFGSLLLRRLSLSLTMNAGDSSDSKQSTATSTTAAAATASTPFTLLTQLKQVSDFTAHFDIVNNRDPMSSGVARKIRKQLSTPPTYFPAADVLGAFIFDDAATEATKLLTFTGDLTTEITDYVTAENNKAANSASVATAEAVFERDASAVVKQAKAFYSGLAHSPTLSVEYSLDRQPMVSATATGSGTAAPPLMNTPDLQTARVIHAYSYYTFNASASFFSQKTAAMPDHWRDLQIGLKFDFPFSGISNFVDKGTFEVSGLFVDLHQMPLGVNLMVNGVAVTQPGKIGLFQAKYTIPVPGSSGVQVPISITYSNRTDLIKETSIQGNIGITWDMSKLVASKQASSQ
jgi:hypothetical protein